MRALPRTANFLANGLSAIQFRKLNKVGVNSRPNAFVTLLGKTTEPMERKVMNLDDIKADFSYEELCHTYLDNETYIPLEYHKAGYKTLDLQDYVASALNYPNCKGIKNNSLDHYYRAFHLRLRSDKELFNTLRQSRCRSSPDYMLDYFSLFLDSYKNYPKFSFTWIVELAHGNGEWLYAGDYALYNFFFTNRRRLSNSFIFFFGDHGARLGREAHTSLGVSELNNPFLYIVVPERLRHTPIYNQLQKNSEDVITHHDLYATFMDILHFQPASNFTDLEFKKYGNHMKGSSLLRRFEPGVLRNCKTLPIPFQYCICQYGKERVNDTVLLDKLGNFVIDRLISLLQYHNVSSQCEQITLKKVEALKYTAPDADSLSIEASIFDVIFEVSQPAKGKFKIPVRKEKDMLIAGEVFERLNRYGHNGDCMDKDFLRPLCTCKSSLESSTKQSTGTSTRKVLQTITRRRKGKT